MTRRWSTCTRARKNTRKLTLCEVDIVISDVSKRYRRMPRKVNEVVVKWLESKDAGKTNRVNVKHIIGLREEIAVEKEVIVKLNT